MMDASKYAGSAQNMTRDQQFADDKIDQFLTITIH